MLRPFSFHEPTSLAEAVTLHATLENAAYYAGGTELLLIMKEGLVRYDHLINLKSIEALRGIEVRENNGRAGQRRLRIGALTRHAELTEDATVARHIPALADLARRIGNIRVRNAGTIGGNLAFGEPRSDLAAFLLALGAEIEAVGLEGSRKIPAGEFWLGPLETALLPDEVVQAVELPLDPSERCGYAKIAVREFPTAGVAMSLTLVDGAERVGALRLAVTAVHAVPTRLPQVEHWASGQEVAQLLNFGPDEWAEVAAGDLHPVDDIYGSKDYKLHLVGVLIARLLRSLVTDAAEA